MPPVVSGLNQRRQIILGLLVGEYIRTASPVASQQIARLPQLKVSPATVRNDMADLEEMAFISRPHASAGAVPADSAYRVHVNQVPPRFRPPKVVYELVEHAIHPDEADAESWARAAASVLSEAVHNVAITTTPRVFQARLKQLHLVQLQERQALLVLVMQEARLRQHMVPLEAPVTQEQLNEVAARLNADLAGKTAEGIRREWIPVPDPRAWDNAVVAETLNVMDLEEQAEPERPYIDGLGHMLGQPEFASGSRAKEAVEALEDDQLLSHVLSEASDTGQVQIIIGEEHRHHQLHTFSVVLSQYGVPGTVMGTICAIGPTRMEYGRAIASVRYLAHVLGGLHAGLVSPTN